MKQLRLITAILGLCLMFVVYSCNGEDRSVFGDNFDYPPLTDANTVRFTVNVTGKWRQLSLVAGGGPMVVEWGDGRTQKIESPEGHVTYKYGNIGSYQVRVWAEELQFLTVGDPLLPVSDLRLGNLPKVKDLTLNSLTETRELDLNSFCPNVKQINIGSCADLETMELDQCKELQNIYIYTNPKLSSIVLGNHPEVKSFICSDNAVTSISLKGMTGLRDAILSYNTELTRLELNEETEIRALSVAGCTFRSIDDILKCCPALDELNCAYNQLTELDLSNFHITELHCDHNQLTRLKVPDGSLLGHLYCHSNQLDEDALTAVFNSLGTVPVKSIENPRPKQCYISYHDNPGINNAHEDQLKEKNWTINKD